MNWQPADWPSPPNVIAGVTTRLGGVSERPFDTLNLGAHVGDDPDAVTENRRRLAAACEMPSEPRWLRQVHGSKALRDPSAGAEADASVTMQPGVVCIVMVADCLPVLLTSDDGGTVAAAHAGWRGLAAGVLEQTVATMDTPPDRLMAWLGPAISQRAFEVGGEVRSAFVDKDPGADDCFKPKDAGKFMADLYALARRRLDAVGVRAVFGGDRCTWSEPEAWFSYRRDGQCGRMGAFIFQRPETLENP